MSNTYRTPTSFVTEQGYTDGHHFACVVRFESQTAAIAHAKQRRHDRLAEWEAAHKDEIAEHGLWGAATANALAVREMGETV